jgi:hypothetical protein
VAALDSKGSGGREAASREQLLLSVLQPTEADLETMRKFNTSRSKLYKKEAQEQRKARKGKEKGDKEKGEKDDPKRYRAHAPPHAHAQSFTYMRSRANALALTLGFGVSSGLRRSRNTSHDDVIRIVVAGPQCGKSCLVARLRFNEFVEVEDPTIRTHTASCMLQSFVQSLSRG